MIAKHPRVNRIHFLKIGHMDEEDAAADHMAETGAGTLQNGRDVAQRLLRLRSTPSGTIPVRGSRPAWPDTNTRLPTTIPGE